MSKSKAKSSAQTNKAKKNTPQKPKNGSNTAKAAAAGNKNGKKPYTKRPNIKAAGKPERTAADILAEARGGSLNIWACLIAFAVPFLLTLIAYIKFDVYPFGKRSVLTLDLNGQYIYYFEGIRDAFWGDGSLFYNWGRNLSGGFMGIIGYYLASPFTFIVILMPKKLILEAVMIMQMCKVGACGLTFSIYAQRAKRLKPIPTVAVSTAYALMSYVAIQLIDPMWIDGPIFLPLIILGVEYLIDDGRKANYIIPTAIMFIANFYIGFMVAIFVAIYFVYYLFFGTKKKYKKIADYAKTCGVMVISTVVVLMCSIIMILPVYNALALGKFDFSEPVYNWKERLFKLPELIPCLLPNQYYSVNVDTGTRMYGRPEIYCGVLTLVLMPLYFCNKKIKFNRKIGNAFLILVMVMSMYIKPLNMYWHGGQDPNWLPFRYSFLLSFILVSMAAETLANLEGYKLSLYSTGGTFAGIFIFVLWFKELMPKYNYNESRYKYVAVKPYKDKMNYGSKTWEELWLGTIVFGLVLVAAYVVLVHVYSHLKDKKARNAVLVAMAGLVCFESGYNCYDSFRKIYKEVGNSCRESYADIWESHDIMDLVEQNDKGFYRSEKTFSRMVNDDMAYGIKGVSHSSSVMNTRALKLLENMGYFTQSFESKYNGHTAFADSLLGIKYVLDDPKRIEAEVDQMKKLYPDKTYEKQFSMSYHYYDDYITHSIIPSTIDVYKNPNALSIGFMADDDITNIGPLGNENPFDNLNNILSALTGNTPELVPDVVEPNISIHPKQYFKRIEIRDEDIVYSEDEIYFHLYGNANGEQHLCYDTKSADVFDPVVNVHFTTERDGEIFMQLGSQMRKQCNVWVGIKGEDGNYHGRNGGTHDSCGPYFVTNSAPIISIGSFNKGDEIEVRFTILPSDGGSYAGSNEYLMVRSSESDGRNGFHFYYLDEDEYIKDLNTLKANQWEIDMSKSNDRRLVGKVTANKGQVLFTSIPYEPGWTVKVDGKKLPVQIVERENDKGKVDLLNYSTGDGQIILMDSLIGIRLPAGEHTVELVYTPPGFTLGVVTLIFGIGFVILFYLYDRRKNIVLVARIKERAQKKSGKSGENAAEQVTAAKKKVEIIKSKGAIEPSDPVIAEVNEKAEKNKKQKARTTEQDAPEESSESEEASDE